MGSAQAGDASQHPEQFRVLVESVQDYAIYMLDPEGRVTTWNLGAERIKGYTAEEIIGQHFSTFYPPEDAETGAPEQEMADARANGRVQLEGWRVRKDGSRFWATVVLTALFDDNGELQGFAKVTRDSTEAKEAEENRRRLAEIRMRQRHALEVNDDIIQGLAVADLALNLDDVKKAKDAISQTLEAARRFVTELLGEPGDEVGISPGDLRRRPAADGD